MDGDRLVTCKEPSSGVESTNFTPRTPPGSHEPVPLSLPAYCCPFPIGQPPRPLPCLKPPPTPTSTTIAPFPLPLSLPTMMHAVDIVRTHEILSRYRPIAPRPPMLDTASILDTTPSPSPARTTSRTPRARKRGRSACSFVSQKRYRTYVPVLPSPLDVSCHQAALSLARGTPVLPFLSGGFPGADTLTPSLLPSSSHEEMEEKDAENSFTLQEKDLLGGMQKASTTIITPQPMRPIGSSVSIEDISKSSIIPAACGPPVTKKKPRDLEEEVESELLPAIVSNSSNRVRLANSAYKVMVGQPECPWLDSIGGSTRISGEVMLDLQDGSIPAWSQGFSCRARIEWACNGQKTSVLAACDVEKLCCESKDYVFVWRFHTVEASHAA